jgi:hypothetical protein
LRIKDIFRLKQSDARKQWWNQGSQIGAGENPIDKSRRLGKKTSRKLVATNLGANLFSFFHK